MKITNSRRFGVKPSGQVFYRVRYCHDDPDKKAIYVEFSVGCFADPDYWDSENHAPKRGSIHVHNNTELTAREIVRKQQEIEDAVDEAFKIYEVERFVPDATEFRKTVNGLLGRENVVAKIKPPKKGGQLSVLQALKTYMRFGEDIKGWRSGTVRNHQSIKSLFTQYDRTLTLSKLAVNDMRGFQVFMTQTKHYRNTTVNSIFKRLRAFFQWCEDEDMHVDPKVARYNPDLKDAVNDVVFLTFEEFEKIFYLKIPETKAYLKRVRDVFCFQCATGLRYGDVLSLRTAHIYAGKINVIMQKTSAPVVVSLNKYSQEILDRYADQDLEDDRVLPVISNQKMNVYLKELAKLAGLMTKIFRVRYIGARRVDIVKEKWQLICTHTARRTFVSISLSLGASQEQVMAITGHSSVKMMERYVGLTEEDKAAATMVWNKGINREKADLLDKLSSLSIEELQKLLQK